MLKVNVVSIYLQCQGQSMFIYMYIIITLHIRCARKLSPVIESQKFLNTTKSMLLYNMRLPKAVSCTELVSFIAFRINLCNRLWNVRHKDGCGDLTQSKRLKKNSHHNLKINHLALITNSDITVTVQGSRYFIIVISESKYKHRHTCISVK